MCGKELTVQTARETFADLVHLPVGIFACHAHPDVQTFKPTALKMGKAYVYLP